MQRFAYGCGIFLSLISYSSIGSAQFVSWNENIPSSLALFQQNPQELAGCAAAPVFASGDLAFDRSDRSDDSNCSHHRD